ncbi:hypothetical protein MRX96_032687 [Rhipicephalus microplus]
MEVNTNGDPFSPNPCTRPVCTLSLCGQARTLGVGFGPDCVSIRVLREVLANTFIGLRFKWLPLLRLLTLSHDQGHTSSPGTFPCSFGAEKETAADGHPLRFHRRQDIIREINTTTNRRVLESLSVGPTVAVQVVALVTPTPKNSCIEAMALLPFHPSEAGHFVQLKPCSSVYALNDHEKERPQRACFG